MLPHRFAPSKLSRALCVAGVIVIVYAALFGSQASNFHFQVMGGAVGVTSALVVLVSNFFYGGTGSSFRVLVWRATCDLCVGLRFLLIPAFNYYLCGSVHCSKNLSYQDLCSFPAVFIEFFLVASEGYFLCNAVDLVYSITNPFSNFSSRLRQYHWFVWCGAIIFTLSPFIVNKAQEVYGFWFVNTNSQDDVVCWLKIENEDRLGFSIWFYFFAPLMFVYLFAILSLWIAYNRLRKGLSKSFLPRLKLLVTNTASVFVLACFWLVFTLVYALAFFFRDNSTVNEVFWNILVFSLASKGLSGLVVWIVVSDPATGGMGSDAKEETIDANKSLREEVLQYATAGIRSTARVSAFTSSSQAKCVRRPPVSISSANTMENLITPLFFLRFVLVQDEQIKAVEAMALNRQSSVPDESRVSLRPSVLRSHDKLSQHNTLLNNPSTRRSVFADHTHNSPTQSTPTQGVDISHISPTQHTHSDTGNAHTTHTSTAMRRSTLGEERFSQRTTVATGNAHTPYRESESDNADSEAWLRQHPPTEVGYTASTPSSERVLSRRLERLRESEEEERRTSVENAPSQSVLGGNGGCVGRERDGEALCGEGEGEGEEERGMSEASVRVSDMVDAAPAAGFDEYGLKIPHSWDLYSRLSNYLTSLYLDSDIVEFTEYEPYHFRRVRLSAGISDEMYINEFSTTIKERLTQGGASGAFFFFSKGENFISKSCTEEEVHTLERNAAKYADYMVNNKKSYISKILGAYKLRIYGNALHFFVMNNLFFNEDGLTMNEKYDIKGSWVSRNAEPPVDGQTVTCSYCEQKFVYRKKSHALAGKNKNNALSARTKSSGSMSSMGVLKAISEAIEMSPMHSEATAGARRSNEDDDEDSPHCCTTKDIESGTHTHSSTQRPLSTHNSHSSTTTPTQRAELCPYTVNGRHAPNLILKDNDIKYKIRLSPETANTAYTQLKSDAEFLFSLGIMDYSLLVGVHNTEYVVREDGSVSAGSGSGGESVNRLVRASVARGAGGLDESLANASVVSSRSSTAVSLGQRHEVFRVVGPDAYFLGIIDFQQEWNLNKKLERFFKINFKGADPDGLSAIEPKTYRDRFLQKIEDILEFDDQRAQLSQ